jgi:long-chain acyl-CoA synthetase
VAGMVPTVCRMLLPAIEADPQKCASLRRIVVTGEAFPVDLKRRLIALLPQVRLVSFFAMTEAGSITSLGHEEQFTHPESVGRPTPGVEVLILAADHTPLPAGEIGELAVRAGAPGQFTVMRGYFNRPDETAAAFHAGFLLTGDLARQHADGYLYIVDRKKDMILSGGFNIYSKEVEQTLCAHPAVADAAVVGVPDPTYGEAVAAFVEPAAGANPTQAELIEHCRRLLASYKKPKYIFITATMPRNGIGKVLKTDLRAEVLRLMEIHHAPP